MDMSKLAAAKPPPATLQHDWDGCGPCSYCGWIYQMMFDNAKCPCCHQIMSRNDAFSNCASYPYSVPPQSVGLPGGSEVTQSVFNKDGSRRGDGYKSDVSKLERTTGSQKAIKDLLVTAEAHLQQQQLAQAIASSTEAIRLDPRCSQAYALRANAYLLQNGPDKATEDANQAIALDSSNALAFSTRGAAASLKGDNVQGIADCTEAIRLDGTLWKAFANRAGIHAKANTLSSAITDFTEALRLNPNHARMLFERGQCYFRNGDHDNAISDFSEAIRLHPDTASPTLFRQRAEAYDHRYDFQEAIADWTAFIHTQSLSLATLLRVANESLHSHEHSWSEGIAACTVALSIDPKNAQAFVSRAAITTLWAHETYDPPLDHLYEQAIADFTSALAINPRILIAHHKRAECHLALKHFTEAVADGRKAFELNPNNHEPLLISGEANQAIEAYSEALNDYSQVTAVAPNDFDGHFQRGVTYCLLGRQGYDNSKSAKAALRTACKKSLVHLKYAYGEKPNDEQVIYWLGRAYHDSGDIPHALEVFEKLSGVSELLEPILAKDFETRLKECRSKNGSSVRR